MTDQSFRQWVRRAGRAGHLNADELLEVMVARRDDATKTSAPAAHAATCAPCDEAADQQAAQFAQLGAMARQAADDRIGADRLARQWDVIERRLEGQPARVLHFPAPLRRPRTQPRVRRWVAMAAASGLIFGLAAGRLLGPTPGSPSARAAWTSDTRPAQAALAPALADEHLLTEVDAALARALHQDFLVLDEITPRGADVAGGLARTGR